MPVPHPLRRRVLLIAWLAPVLLLADALVAAAVSLTWTTVARRQLTAAEAAPFNVLGAGAAVGVLIFAITTITAIMVLRGRNAAPATTALVALAGIRLAAVPVAAAIIAVVAGLSAVAGLLEAFLFILAGIDALAALAVTGSLRRTVRLNIRTH